ncbi:hypothetical protein BJ508DRAFT_415960 [Ascobolus immersus RN42]|uniref:UBX domain-containing protein n=1 Tax=Ascobolus immersus RN42 TaxID=1160509 RepID=A0A3N4I563_ASCIM|nr:hypothetical protein BJ508DRAFT_415960 [Ascobolus immersus RN42]
MSEQESLIDRLKDIFPNSEDLVKQVASQGLDFEAAVNWIADRIEPAVEKLTGSSGEQKKEDADEEEEESAEAIANSAQSLRCVDCGKLFSTPERAEFHAIKTEHQNFEESKEAVKPLTKEERDAKLAEMREKLAAKRAAQAAQDAIEQKKNEAIRRKKDSESERLKEELKAKQAKLEMEKQKKEKAADIAAKKRVEESIRLAQEERRAKAAAAKAAREGRVVEEALKPAVPAKENNSASGATEARLQLRIQGQPPLIKTFPADTTLFEVASAVQEERGFTVQSFTTPFPRKTFTKEDFGNTLKEAKMVPSAALILG